MTMADRIAIMDQGRVMQVATPAEIYEAPVSRFVADFVGSINLLEGTLLEAGRSGARIRDVSGAEFRVTDAGEGQVGQTVWLAVRPEKVRVTRQRPADVRNALEGEVWDIAYLGDMTVYNVKLDDGRLIKASSINSVRAVEDALTWHDRAWVSFAEDAGVVLVR